MTFSDFQTTYTIKICSWNHIYVFSIPFLIANHLGSGSYSSTIGVERSNKCFIHLQVKTWFSCKLSLIKPKRQKRNSQYSRGYLKKWSIKSSKTKIPKLNLWEENLKWNLLLPQRFWTPISRLNNQQSDKLANIRRELAVARPQSQKGMLLNKFM